MITSYINNTEVTNVYEPSVDEGNIMVVLFQWTCYEKLLFATAVQRHLLEMWVNNINAS